MSGLLDLWRIPRLSWGLRRVWQRNFLVYRKHWLASLVENFAEPILYLTAMGVGVGGLVASVSGLSYLQFIAPGLLASAAMMTVTFECTWGSWVRMEFQKTYDAIIATPLSVEDVVAGELAWGATKSAWFGTVILAVQLAFGLVPSAWALLVPAVLLLTGLLFGIMALTCTAVIRNIDGFTYYFSLVVTPLFLFSGIFYPLSNLPGWAQQVAWFLPLVHAVNAVRALVLGHVGVGGAADAAGAAAAVPAGAPWADILWLAVAVVALWPLPINLMRRKLIQ